MKKHISFPSIEQFRVIVSKIQRQYNFVGLDENGEAIYDETRTKPTLIFKGTVKLHGTNLGVCFNDISGIWVQSRENIITTQNDNAGSAFFVLVNNDAFLDLFNEIKNKYNIDTANNTISIYGEWVGKGIQKNIAISKIEKSMFIFGIKINPHDENKVAYWVDSSSFKKPENRIYNIEDYETYTISIDFNNPALSQDEIIELTSKVENECPVGKAFGFSDIGEGIVFSHLMDDGTCLKFKSKGEKHVITKVKKLNPVDDEKLNNIIEVVNKVTPNWRLEQMLDKTFDLMNEGELDIKKMGEFIKNVINDVIKEESDVIAEANLIPKDINSKISEVCRNYFFDMLNKEVGLK